MNDISKLFLIQLLILVLAIYGDKATAKDKKNFVYKWWRTIISVFCLGYTLTSAILIKYYTNA